MKKLLISFVALLFIFSAGNALAGAPNCGLWLGGQGTYSQSLDTDWNNTAFEATALCIIGTADPRPLWKWSRTATSCDVTKQSAMYGLVWYPDPWYPPALFLTAEHATRSSSAVPSAIGTMQVLDYRDAGAMGLQVVTADIIETEGRAKIYWSPGNYTGTNTGASGCDYEHGASPSTLLPNIILIENRVIGQVQGASEYTELHLWGSFKQVQMVAGAPSVSSGMVKSMRIEVRKPLRGDLNGDGQVGGPDYFIFAADWVTKYPSASCSCGIYWR